MRVWHATADACRVRRRGREPAGRGTGPPGRHDGVRGGRRAVGATGRGVRGGPLGQGPAPTAAVPRGALAQRVARPLTRSARSFAPPGQWLNHTALTCGDTTGST
ncbi:hypothetical protein DDQ41_06090 [Streptomyces spongiicola]|uniref:Uncharacterized protein n=1 Tax=Streptomyces spongiicola TaxID=1690221 RepID=A0ABN5KDC2_9ACTN|nr:hypothetical protein DDQ41_06090 [Streptomyces spongiicola]